MEPLSLNPSFKMESQVVFHFLLPPHAPYSSLYFTSEDLSYRNYRGCAQKSSCKDVQHSAIYNRKKSTKQTVSVPNGRELARIIIMEHPLAFC